MEVNAHTHAFEKSLAMTLSARHEDFLWRSRHVYGQCMVRMTLALETGNVRLRLRVLIPSIPILTFTLFLTTGI